MGRLSIAAEIEAVQGSLETSPEGLAAFRHGCRRGQRTAESFKDSDVYTMLDDITTPLEVQYSNSDEETAKAAHPEEYILGLAVGSYKERKGQA